MMIAGNDAAGLFSHLRLLIGNLKKQPNPTPAAQPTTLGTSYRYPRIRQPTTANRPEHETKPKSTPTKPGTDIKSPTPTNPRPGSLPDLPSITKPKRRQQHRA